MLSILSWKPQAAPPGATPPRSASAMVTPAVGAGSVSQASPTYSVSPPSTLPSAIGSASETAGVNW